MLVAPIKHGLPCANVAAIALRVAFYPADLAPPRSTYLSNHVLQVPRLAWGNLVAHQQPPDMPVRCISALGYLQKSRALHAKLRKHFFQTVRAVAQDCVRDIGRA